MRHAVVVLILAATLLVVWRIRALTGAGADLHRKELAARALAERILRAEVKLERDQLARGTPSDGRAGPYEYLSELIARRRVDGLEPVEGGDRERYVAGGYVFHVRLLNRIGRPLPRPPAEREPGFGQNFELWAWPADERDTTLALFFGSDAGRLLQGDNGTHAGVDARPEEASGSPSKAIADSPIGATDAWVPLLDLSDS